MDRNKSHRECADCPAWKGSHVLLPHHILADNCKHASEAAPQMCDVTNRRCSDTDCPIVKPDTLGLLEILRTDNEEYAAQTPKWAQAVSVKFNIQDVRKGI